MKAKYVLFLGSFLLIFLITLFVGLYFWKFHNGLSTQVNDWAAFGSYIGGVITPILTIINIGVFIWLTLVIKNAGDEQKKKELEYQRKLLMTNFRQSELYKLQSKLEEVIDTTAENRLEAAYKARRYLTSIRLPFGSIFGSNRSYLLGKEFIDYEYLIELLDEIIEFCTNEKSFEEINKTLVNYHAMVVLTKASIQDFIIKDLA